MQLPLKMLNRFIFFVKITNVQLFDQILCKITLIFFFFLHVLFMFKLNSMIGLICHHVPSSLRYRHQPSKMILWNFNMFNVKMILWNLNCLNVNFLVFILHDWFTVFSEILSWITWLIKRNRSTSRLCLWSGVS